MLQKIKNHLYTYYRSIVSSIAFYPALIAVIMFFLAQISLAVESKYLNEIIADKAPFLTVVNVDTARAILTTLIGGLISLTVFSFSMVMVLLNQASSNFSPRLLPGLITDKRNQLVLGVYLGSILFNTIVLMQINPQNADYLDRGISVLIGIIWGIVCMGFFVFFIHSISTNLQISNILSQIFTKSKNRLLYHLEKEDIYTNKKADNDYNDWHNVKNKRAGYFQEVNLDGINAFCEENETDIFVVPYKGEYIFPAMTILKSSKKLDENQEKELEELFIFSNNSSIENNYTLGFKQIAEVGIKAMSPGINDPGTALVTIDHLTQLFALRMKLGDREVYHTPKKSRYIEFRTINFKDLIYQTMAAYRQYCKHDVIIMQKLALMLKYLLTQADGKDPLKEIVLSEISMLEEDVHTSIENQSDREQFKKFIQDIKEGR